MPKFRKVILTSRTLVSPPAEEEVLSRPVKTQLDLAAVARVASVAEKDAMLWLFKLHMEGKEPPEDKAILSCIVLSFLLLLWSCSSVVTSKTGSEQRKCGVHPQQYGTHAEEN